MLKTQRNTATPVVDVHFSSSATSRRRRTRSATVWIVGLSLILLGVCFFGVMVGSVNIAPETVLAVLGNHLWGAQADVATSADTIVWQVRVPRVLLAVVAGAGLAVAGVALQAAVRNVLADPYILGVNSGASVGAAAAILFGAGAVFGEFALQGSAFAGALVAMLLVATLAHGAGRGASTRLLMAGVAVGYALSAATSFLVFAADSAEGSRSVMFWLLGSLGLAAWGAPLAAVTVAVLMCGLVLWALSRQLDTLSVGDDTALSLGVSPGVVRGVLLAVTSLLVGSVVAAAGSIGFVGLIIPHLARRLVGGRHAVALPTSALLGSILLVGADVTARTVLAPQEVPIGVVTALVGTPFLVAYIYRMRSRS